MTCAKSIKFCSNLRSPCYWPLPWWSSTPLLTTNANIIHHNPATIHHLLITEELEVIRPTITTLLTVPVILTIPATIGVNHLLTQAQQEPLLTAPPVIDTQDHWVTNRPPFRVSSDGLVGHRSPVSELLELNR